MRYPCSDGIDRDVYIDRYISKARKLGEVQSQLRTLTELERQLLKDMSELRKTHLGKVGLQAAHEEMSRTNRFDRPKCPPGEHDYPKGHVFADRGVMWRKKVCRKCGNEVLKRLSP